MDTQKIIEAALRKGTATKVYIGDDEVVTLVIEKPEIHVYLRKRGSTAAWQEMPPVSSN